jgi:hypothetical protein
MSKSYPEFEVISPHEEFNHIPVETSQCDHISVGREAVRREAIMAEGSKLISPLDADYAEHREAAERQRSTREWLERRERELGLVTDAPPVAPRTPGR